MKITPLALGLAIVGLHGWANARAESASESFPRASLYREARPFVDDTGTRLDLSSFEGRPIILTMFYARCQSTCPVTFRKLRQIDEAFAARGRPIEIVLVSYDPASDTPRALARFRVRQKLSARWHLLSGRHEAVGRLAQRIGLDRYLDMGEHIFHSYRIVLLDESGVVRRALDMQHDKISSLFEEGAGAEPRTREVEP